LKDFKNKNCFITGAASGIGRSFALKLAKEGMKLFITDIDTEGLERVKKEIEQTGAVVHSMKCDVSKFSDIENAAKVFYSKLGDVDLLINNAGIGRNVNLSTMDLERWKMVFDVNLWSVIYSLKVFLPRMLERKSGHIVNVASGAGLFGSSEPLSYITTKFAVVGLSEGIFSRLKPFGINVSVITPALIRTNIFHKGLESIEYNPKMLKDIGKEKIDEIYGSLMDNLMNTAMSPDVAVRKYVRQIKKDQLYIFDSQGTKDIIALKGKDMKEYEEFLLSYQNMQAKGIREQFEKYGLNFDDYI